MPNKKPYRITVSNDSTFEQIKFMAECNGFATISKFMDFLIMDYRDTKYNFKELQRENEFLKTVQKRKSV